MMRQENSPGKTAQGRTSIDSLNQPSPQSNESKSPDPLFSLEQKIRSLVLKNLHGHFKNLTKDQALEIDIAHVDRFSVQFSDTQEQILIKAKLQLPSPNHQVFILPIKETLKSGSEQGTKVTRFVFCSYPLRAGIPTNPSSTKLDLAAKIRPDANVFIFEFRNGSTTTPRLDNRIFVLDPKDSKRNL